MANKKQKTILYRRKREQRTDYPKRLKLLKSRKPRLVVRFTNQKIITQIIKFNPEGDNIITGIDSFALKKKGWDYSGKNFPAAYLTGLLIGKKALENNCNEAVFDCGFKQAQPKGKMYAFLKGVLDAGVKVPRGSEEKIFPSEERVSGKNLADYKKDPAIMNKFAEIKKKIKG